MCPNGVEWKTIKETVGVNRGRRLTKSQLKEDGLYEVYHGSKDTPLGRYDDYNAPKDTIIVVNTGGIGGVKYLDKAFWCSDGSFWLGHSTGISNKFLYYFLSRYEDYFESQKRVGGVPTIDRNVIENFEIPLPPIEIQKKIVECLDKFSALAAELQAELQLRRKQYEYYRTQLLTPHSDCNSADNTDDRNWEWKTLGEVCEINRGVRVVRSELEQEGKYPVYQNSLTPLGYYDKCNYPANTTFIISAGAAGKVGFSDVDFWAADDCLCIKCPEIISSKYLYYYMLDKQDFFLSQVRHASVPRMSRTVVENFKLPLPPLAEQARIVSILDKFEALTTSLSDGIPAEQAAQQKRYEYYRDLLLTFPRKEA